MKKMNNKGFALVETLIVSAFVMGIFTLMFTNFYPMIGEYEKRENYDDIDSVYKTYYIKNMMERYGLATDANNKINSLYSSNDICSSGVFNTDGANECKNMIAAYNVKTVIFYLYDIENLKNRVPSYADSYLKDYINYLPKFSKNPNNIKYRLIVEYEVEINNESNTGKRTVYRFSTIGVGK